MSYPRKSTFTVQQLLNSLSVNQEFSDLDDAQKMALVNEAMAEIASYRNSKGLEDYWFSTDDAGAVFGTVTVGDLNNFDLGEKAWVQIIAPNKSWQGSSSSSPRVFTYQGDYTSFGYSIVADGTAPGGYVIHLTSAGAFSEGILPLNNQPYVTKVEYVSSSLIKVTPKASWGVLTLVLMEVL